jgi:tetratricopeptide (TPR) repeat protein
VTSRRRRAQWTRVALGAVFTVTASGAHAQGNTRAIVLPKVNTALSAAKSGRFAEARQNLETLLAGCGTGADGRDCRVLSAAGLGAVLQRQGSADRRNHDSLYTASVAYYDRILREVPNSPDALYGKALAYRALGPHEWQESFFKQAPSLDSARASLYFTFQGDYYASAKRLPEAAAAFRQAVRQNGENDGARAGLVDALAALGRQSSLELLQSARDWESRYPESASSAYRAVLINAFAPGSQRDAIADSAMLGLVRVQTRNRLAVGAVPREVSVTWTPVREIRSFLDSARATVAPWWGLTDERRTVLAQSALAGGKAAAAAGRFDAAEHLFAEGVRIARRSSSVSLDLQRELALLYFHHSELDASRAKFDALEQNIFEGKMGALASGDLEAAQRYHTTLGLIYAERGVWTSSTFARNAEQQLGWALDKADERQQRQRFYQPLPELRRWRTPRIRSAIAETRRGATPRLQKRSSTPTISPRRATRCETPCGSVRGAMRRSPSARLRCVPISAAVDFPMRRACPIALERSAERATRHSSHASDSRCSLTARSLQSSAHARTRWTRSPSSIRAGSPSLAATTWRASSGSCAFCFSPSASRRSPHISIPCRRQGVRSSRCRSAAKRFHIGMPLRWTTSLPRASCRRLAPQHDRSSCVCPPVSSPCHAPRRSPRRRCRG